MRCLLSLAAVLLVPACFETATVGSDGIATTGVFSDKLPHSTLEIYLAHDADAHGCTWDGRGSLDIALLVDDRTRPHVLPGLDVQVIPGSVAFDDGDHAIAAVDGRVSPTLTTWGFRGDTNQFDRIVQVDGTIDVVLADGRPLTGSFSAIVCDD